MVVESMDCGCCLAFLGSSPVLMLTSCVIEGKLLHVTVPHSEDDSNVCSMGGR